MIPKDKKEISAALTIGIREDEVWIEVEDCDASIKFLRLRISHSEFVNALGRLVHRPCKCELRGLDKICKRMEHKMFEFPMPEGVREWDKEVARAEVGLALELAGMEDWEPSEQFSSQNSFFKRDDKPMAMTRIRRWVDIEDVEVS